MENKILAHSGSLRCDIGKRSPMATLEHDSVNVMTNFEPLSQAIFLLELKASDVVFQITNVAYYGPDDGGGLSVLLAKGKTEMDLQTVISGLLEKASQGLF